VIVTLGFVGFVFLVVAGLMEVGRLIETVRGPDGPPPRPTSPAVHSLHVHLNQPGGRAKFRNVCLVVGAIPIAPYVALLIYNRA
jgi:hypothetical protein